MGGSPGVDTQENGADGPAPDGKLHVPSEPGDSSKANVEGKEISRPIDGFGQLWRKTYQLPLTGAAVTPEEVVMVWKTRLPDFMPENSRFYPTLCGVEAGEVVLIQASLPGGLPVSTGVLVLYADDVHFTIVTPEGHPESGYNSFSAEVAASEGGDATVVAQIQSLARATDPLFEFGYRFLGGHRHQEQIWRHVLLCLGEHFGVQGAVTIRRELLDRRIQWRKAPNLWHNSAIRTTLQAPFRIVRRFAGERK